MFENLQNIGNILLTVLGISFLIFMHELGHFLAARLFKVRVEIFSIGFGPRLLGRRRGDTDYRVSAIPLGGYVKMAGEYSDLGDPGAEPVDDGSDLMSKPIWQRFVIFMAGPLMNLALAFLMYPAAFGGGAPFVTPTLGDVQPGGPAWTAGLQPGDDVLTVNGSRVYGFTDILLEVALGDPSGSVLRVRRDGEVIEATVVPTRVDGRYDIGISPPQSPALTVVEDGAAERAGLRSGDVLVSMDGREVGASAAGRILTPVGVWLAALADPGPVDVVVERDGQPLGVTVDPDLRPGLVDEPLVGAGPLETAVEGLRGPAAQDGYPLRKGDVLLRAGERLLLTAEDVHAAASRPGPLDLTVHREGERVPVPLDEDDEQALLAGDVALGLDLRGTSIIRPRPGGPLADAGLQDGDELVRVDDRPVPHFRGLQDVLRDDAERVDHEITYRRNGVERTVAVRARALPQPDLGMGLSPAKTVYDFSLGEALVAGFDVSVNTLLKTGLTLSKLFTGEVSAENLGGPLQIGVLTYDAATLNLARLLFILALLSVNLGIINLLPIPVLDGGQIVFLLCEKIKGSRLSERFMHNAQLAGFVAILALMVYVTVNDVIKIL